MAIKAKQTPRSVVQGEALWRTLGFKNERAFQRARQSGWSEVPLYPIAGQSRGVYARLDELMAYVERQPATKRGEEGDMR